MALRLHMMLAGAAFILGLDWAGTSKMAHAHDWCLGKDGGKVGLSGVTGRVGSLSPLKSILSSAYSFTLTTNIYTARIKYLLGSWCAIQAEGTFFWAL